MSNDNEFNKFLSLVQKMRKRQKKYYNERTYENLINAKDCEAQVDREIKRLLPLASEDGIAEQAALF